MKADDSDRDAIDRLVRQLNVPGATGASSDPISNEQVGSRPGSRWTNVRLVMPSRPEPTRWQRLTTEYSAKLPQLPGLPQLPNLSRKFPKLPRLSALWELTRFAKLRGRSRLPDLSGLLQMPGSATTVRIWVGLAVLYSISMAFWPYPKTYFVGLVSYLLADALLVVAGVWGARLSWDDRLGGAHTISLAIVFWSVALATVETAALI